jgi:predicted amidohydrolase
MAAGFLKYFLPKDKVFYSLFENASENLELIAKYPEKYSIKTFDIEGVKLDIFNSYRTFVNIASSLWHKAAHAYVLPSESPSPHNPNVAARLRRAGARIVALLTRLPSVRAADHVARWLARMRCWRNHCVERQLLSLAPHALRFDSDW